MFLSVHFKVLKASVMVGCHAIWVPGWAPSRVLRYSELRNGSGQIGQPPSQVLGHEASHSIENQDDHILDLFT